MRNTTYMVLGHLVFFSLIIAIYLVVLSNEDGRIPFPTIIWLPVCFACFATYVLEPETFQRAIPRFASRMCRSRISAFINGCLIGLIQLIIMFVIGVPLYILYNMLFPHNKETAFWFVVFFTFFWFATMVATNGIVVLVGRKYEHEDGNL